MTSWNQVFHLEDDWLIAFLDIVGFSNAMIKNQNATMDEMGAHIDFEQISQHIIEMYSPEYQKQSKIHFLWISDSIFLAAKKDNANQLLEEIDNIVNTFFCTHFSVRGGIALGKLYYKENVWGPALIQAVRMEETAVYPRILISKRILPELGLVERYNQNFIPISYSDYAYYDFFSSFLGDKVAKKQDISAFLSVYTGVISENFQECLVDKHKQKWAFLCSELCRTIDANAEYINACYTEQLRKYEKTAHLPAEGYIDKMRVVLDYIQGGHHG